MRRSDASRSSLQRRHLAAPGVGFDAEHPQVRLVFMVGTPQASVEDHLLAVAAITRLLQPEGRRAGLLAARTEAEFRALLARGSQR